MVAKLSYLGLMIIKSSFKKSYLSFVNFCSLRIVCLESIEIHLKNQADNSFANAKLDIILHKTSLKAEFNLVLDTLFEEQ